MNDVTLPLTPLQLDVLLRTVNATCDGDGPDVWAAWPAEWRATLPELRDKLAELRDRQIPAPADRVAYTKAAYSHHQPGEVEGVTRCGHLIIGTGAFAHRGGVACRTCWPDPRAIDNAPHS